MLTSPLRVAHLVDTLHPDGGEYGLVALAGAARTAGLELVVVGISGAGDGRRAAALRAAGATVVEHGLAPWDPRAVPRVLDTLREHGVALIHTHSPNADVAGSAAATRLRLPVFSTLHRIEDEPADRLDRLRRTAKTMARARFVTRTIAVSRLQVDWYRRVAGSARGLVVLPDGVADPEPVDRERARAVLGLGAADVLVVSAAPMRRGKGQDLLLDAVAALPPDLPATVVLTGDGPLRPWLEARVAREAELSGRVVVRPLADPPALLQAADVQVHVTRTDVMPSAVVRGLAAGIPVVTSRVGGLPEIVTRETGRQVPLTAQAVAEALTELASDATLRARLGTAARTRFEERFEAGGWAARLRALYDSTLG
ncbi:glycosyltransferase family 4 protein [Pseudonocardia xishanensis]|uniref:Glycosyltransferase subfamily 4-like N-terminal domain-containing protein n=1 Tax=Pseudonocardia xishanensis TaxID=630995 RepID=A0ABP8RXS1_9PSEU